MQNNTFSGLFVEQKIIALQQVDSTNNYLRQELTKSKPLPEGTVIMAEDQFAGRGQFTNKWLSQPGKNLTFSILLYPAFLSPQKQFLLNIAVSIAINEFLVTIIGSECKIKWPNDIFYNDAKVGGVLIENILHGNTWKYAIVGIGINVNQTSFDDSLTNVTSLKNITGSSFDRYALLNKLCATIETRYTELKNDGPSKQYDHYRSRLYRCGQLHKFEIDGAIVNGKVVDVETDGHLVLEVSGQKHRYGYKEIKYVLPDL